MPPRVPGAEPTQLVTVITEGWNDFHAQLQRYSRDAKGAWRTEGAPIAAVIGRAGLGWGRGLHGSGAPAGLAGPEKREGDLRSPAGRFALGQVYGYAEGDPRVALRYQPATPELRCVDDPESAHYNQIVALGETHADWDSAEHMRRTDALYELAIVVEHNTRDRVPGEGSCIFLHVWAAPETPVTGCTAMDRESLETLAHWLRPGAVLVSLPRTEYDALKGPWGLPQGPPPRP